MSTIRRKEKTLPDGSPNEPRSEGISSRELRVWLILCGVVWISMIGWLVATAKPVPSQGQSASAAGQALGHAPSLRAKP